MKKISFILLAIAFIFASCEKESKFIDVEIINISSDTSESMIVATYENLSDLDFYCNFIFKIDGELVDEWETDCIHIVSRSSDYIIFKVEGCVYFVECKVKLCEI